MKDLFAKFLCRSGTVCKDVAYEEISRGARKVHPFFHSEQPNAVLPLMICPFPQSGQRSPSLGAGGVAGIMVVGGAILRVVFWVWSAFLSRLPFFPWVQAYLPVFPRHGDWCCPPGRYARFRLPFA